MGYNIGVSAISEDNKIDYKCDNFIDRTFYYWVIQQVEFEEESCIMKVGLHFNIDLKPLTKLIYLEDTIGDSDIEYYKSGLQDLKVLLNLISELIESIKLDPTFIHKISYKTNSLKYNLWSNYFENLEIIDHLNILSKSIKCYRVKGFEKVFLNIG